MKRLIKKSGVWWDPNLPGVMSDEGEYAVVRDNSIVLYDDDGSFLREVSFSQLNLSNKADNDTIKEKVINYMNSYLSRHKD